MRQVITHWSNIFSLFFAFMTREVNLFFVSGGNRNDGGLENNPNPKQTLYKIPRLGR